MAKPFYHLPGQLEPFAKHTFSVREMYNLKDDPIEQ
jgi:hypothetical protein